MRAREQTSTVILSILAILPLQYNLTHCAAPLPKKNTNKQKS